jgi:6-phosphogluconolactonase
VADEPCVFRSADPIAHAGAILANAIAESDAALGRTRLAIPGGSALAALREAKLRLGGALFARTIVTWVDERCVPFDDERSNRGLAHREGIVVRAENGTVTLYDDGEEPSGAVARVEREIDRVLGGAIDVTLLGMGEDGHIASLFPGSRHDGRVAWVRDSPKPPSDRITLTRPLLATARTTVLVALGEGKRSALERVVRSDSSLPATGLPNLQIVTDLELERT